MAAFRGFYADLCRSVLSFIVVIGASGLCCLRRVFPVAQLPLFSGFQAGAVKVASALHSVVYGGNSSGKVESDGRAECGVCALNVLQFKRYVWYDVDGLLVPKYGCWLVREQAVGVGCVKVRLMRRVVRSRRQRWGIDAVLTVTVVRLCSLIGAIVRHTLGHEILRGGRVRVVPRLCLFVASICRRNLGASRYGRPDGVCSFRCFVFSLGGWCLACAWVRPTWGCGPPGLGMCAGLGYMKALPPVSADFYLRAVTSLWLPVEELRSDVALWTFLEVSAPLNFYRDSSPCRSADDYLREDPFTVYFLSFQEAFLIALSMQFLSQVMAVLFMWEVF